MKMEELAEKLNNNITLIMNRLEKLEADSVAASQALAMTAVAAAKGAITEEALLKQITALRAADPKLAAELERKAGLVPSQGLKSLVPGLRAYQEARAGQICPAVHSALGDASIGTLVFFGGRWVIRKVVELF